MNKKIIVLFSALVASSSWADRFCYGELDRIGVGQWNESVYIYSSDLFGGNNDGRTLCSLSQTHNGISPSFCEKWLSFLTTSLHSKAKLEFDYGKDNTEKACNERLTWDSYIAPMQIKLIVE